jgi:hypothetical protein
MNKSLVSEKSFPEGRKISPSTAPNILMRVEVEMTLQSDNCPTRYPAQVIGWILVILNCAARHG